MIAIRIFPLQSHEMKKLRITEVYLENKLFSLKQRVSTTTSTFSGLLRNFKKIERIVCGESNELEGNKSALDGMRHLMLKSENN